MSDTISVTGLVATVPRHTLTPAGLAVTTFRLASQQRRFDRAQNKWVDGETNWFTIVGFRQLASNAALSLQKGHRVVVTGRLRIRDWQSDDKKGINVEIDAEAIGHDLTWGTAAFTRSAMTRVAESEAAEATGSAEGTAPAEGDALPSDGDPASDGVPPGAQPEDERELAVSAAEPAGAVAPF
ncbi:MAG: single-stranded DNA-binding protein [Microbacteriaceae bacterium]|nr:single-stranded DNA-binding protein [Microbacteriaceae bacterium]